MKRRYTYISKKEKKNGLNKPKNIQKMEFFLKTSFWAQGGPKLRIFATNDHGYNLKSVIFRPLRDPSYMSKSFWESGQKYTPKKQQSCRVVVGKKLSFSHILRYGSKEMLAQKVLLCVSSSYFSAVNLRIFAQALASFASQCIFHGLLRRI